MTLHDHAPFVDYGDEIPFPYAVQAHGLCVDYGDGDPFRNEGLLKGVHSHCLYVDHGDVLPHPEEVRCILQVEVLEFRGCDFAGAYRSDGPWVKLSSAQGYW